MPASLGICVFCASADGLDASHVAVAERLGAELARRGHRLVYGGGSVGLMGVVARAVHAGGGRVFGVMPRSLLDREIAYTGADELLVTDTLRERKAEMDARADGFVGLPGGFGTLEELLEVMTLRQLGVHRRPIVLVDVGGYYDPLREMARRIVRDGFARAGEGSLFEVVEEPEAALDLVEAAWRAG